MPLSGNDIASGRRAGGCNPKWGGRGAVTVMSLLLAGCASSPLPAIVAPPVATAPVQGGAAAETAKAVPGADVVANKVANVNEAADKAHTAQTANGFFQLAAPAVTGALGGLSLNMAPVAAYTVVARQINRCWLRGEPPVLANVQFHAKTSVTPAETAKISLYEKQPNARRGPRVYTIELTPTMGGSAMFVENHRLEGALAHRLHADLARWAAGEKTCLPSPTIEGAATAAAPLLSADKSRQAKTARTAKRK